MHTVQEPLRVLFRGEDRTFGRQRKIHEELVGIHAFPFTDICVRSFSEVTLGRAALVHQTGHVLISMSQKPR